MALLHFYIPCALIMAFQFAQKIRGVIGRKIEIDIFLSKWKKLRYYWSRYILLKKLFDILEIFSQPI